MPFALVGGVWLIWLLDYNLSVADVVSFIALAGVAAETGVIMLIYLDHARVALQAKCREPGRTPNVDDLYAAIMAGLLPILWGAGTGSQVMSRIAAPMVGGMLSSTCSLWR